MNADEMQTRPFQVGDKVRCTLHYAGADHTHDYEILAIGEVMPSHPELGRAWTVRELDTGDVADCSFLEWRHPRLLGGAE